MRISHFLPKYLPLSESWIDDYLSFLHTNKKIKNSIFCLQKTDKKKNLKHIEQLFCYHDLDIINKSFIRLQGLITNVNPANIFWEKKLLGIKSDLCHVHFASMSNRANKLITKLKIPSILTVYGSDILRFNSKNLPFDLKKSFADYKLILCTSNFLSKRLMSFGVPKKKIIVWNLGVDTNLFSPSSKITDKKIITCIGRLIYIKGQEYLIHAVAKLKKLYSDITINFVGDGPNYFKLNSLAENLGIKSQVNFLGSIPHLLIPDIIQKSMIVIQPSITESYRQEAFGMAIVEANACGVPVIASNIGGIPEIISNSENGFLVPEKNFAALANTIDTLLKNKQLRKKMGENGRKKVLQKFNLSKQTGLLYDIYKSI